MKASLETERLLLRPFKEDDAQAMFEGWTSDSEVTKYLTWNAHENVETTKAILALWLSEYEKPEKINFAIVDKADGVLIGGIDVVRYLEGTPVIGYTLSRKYWNRGYMTEACKALLTFLKGLGYTQARIDAAVDNVGSNRVIQKCGGVFQRIEIDDRPLHGDSMPVNVYLIDL